MSLWIWALLLISIGLLAVGSFFLATKRKETKVTETPLQPNVKTVADVTRGTAHKPDPRTTPYPTLQFDSTDTIHLDGKEFDWQAIKSLEANTSQVVNARTTKDGTVIAAKSDTDVPCPFLANDRETTFGPTILYRSQALATTPENELFIINQNTDGVFALPSDLSKTFSFIPLPKVNNLGSLGNMGLRSFVVSADGLRAFLSYKVASPQVPTQFSGSIFRFTRERITDNFKVEAKSLSNPQGQQIPQFNTILDPYTNEMLEGDDYGSVIRCTVNSRSENYMFAVRSALGVNRNDGAFIAIYQETSSQGKSEITLDYVVSTTLTTDFEKNNFGYTFDISDKWLIVSVPGRYDKGTVIAAKVIVFERQNDDTWDLKSTLMSPDSSQWFGYNITIDPVLGKFVVIGSPTRPTINSSGVQTTGIGGNVYVYKIEDNGILNLVDTLSAPTEESDAGAFGMFVNIDPTFRVAIVSSNTDNSCQSSYSPLQFSDSKTPKLVVIPLNPSTGQFLKDKPRVVTQHILNNYNDPMYSFGSSVFIQPDDTVFFSVPTPINDEIRIMRTKMVKV